MCGGSNLSTDLLLWGIYIKTCISLVRICLQTRNTRNASTKLRKTSESKKAEKSLEISAFLVFSCLHLNQTLIMCCHYKTDPYKAIVQKQSMIFAVRVHLSLGADGCKKLSEVCRAFAPCLQTNLCKLGGWLLAHLIYSVKNCNKQYQ